jgi:hypothetical protein
MAAKKQVNIAKQKLVTSSGGGKEKRVKWCGVSEKSLSLQEIIF